MRSVARSRPNRRISPTQPGAPSPVVTVMRAKRTAWSWGSGTYAGVLPSSARFCAEASGCHEPGSVPSEIATVDADAVSARVMPMLSSRLAAPRSTTASPVHCVAHQLVVALPSIALPAACPVLAELAEALPPSAKLTLRGAAAEWAGDDASVGSPESPAMQSVPATIALAAAATRNRRCGVHFAHRPSFLALISPSSVWGDVDVGRAGAPAAVDRC